MSNEQKSLTKEDIVKEEYEKIFTLQKYEKSVNRKMNEWYFLPAMDRFAAQQSRTEAIAFAEWAYKKGYECYLDSELGILWCDTDGGDVEANSVYDLFIKDIKQNP